MRVVLIGPVYPYRGGIAHYTAMLARALAERHETLVISFKRQYPGWLYPGKSDRDPSQRPLRVEAEYVLDPVDPRTWRHAARRATEFGADLVIMQWWTTFWAPAFGVLARLLRRQGHRVVFVIHNVLPHEARPWDRAVARGALRAGHGFVVSTEQEKSNLLAVLPDTPQSGVVVRPHPVYDMFAADAPAPREARERLGLPGNAPVLLFFGLVRPYKGLMHLIEALREVRSLGLDFHLVVAGEFWEDKRTYLEALERTGLVAHVTVVDRYIPDEELSLYFSACDAVVLPYVHATQSGVAQLAIGFNRPVIGTSVGDLPQMSGLGESVILVPPANSQALAQAIVGFLRNRPRSGAPVHAPRREWADLVAGIETVAA